MSNAATLGLATLGLSAAGKVLPAIIIFVIGILAIRIINKVLKVTLEKSKLEKAAHTLILSLTTTCLYVLLGLIVASSLGIDVTSIVALASVLTLALSLALQNMVSNIIGGFTILYTHPFHSGDFVEIAGKSGTVHEIGMSYTVLLTPDNKRISIPNSSVVAGDIINYTVTGTRRVDVPISVSYTNDPQKVVDTLLQAADMSQVLADPAPVIAMKEYNQQSITYGMMLWCKSENYWDLKFAVNRELSRLAKENGISFYDPHLSIRVEK